MTNQKRADTNHNDGHDQAPTPEDVAGLYTWANLEALKYRDFSDSRKKSRAQVRDQRREEKAASEQEQGANFNAVAAERRMKPAAVDRVSSITSVPGRNLAAVPGPSPQAPIQARTAQKRRPRWTALNGVFKQAGVPTEMRSVSSLTLETPAMALVSVAGGVGKTSLVAALGASLAALGESVLLVDTNACSLLPLHFGAGRSTAGELLTCALDNTTVPVHILTLDRSNDHSDASIEPQWMERLDQQVHGRHRVLIDVCTGSFTLIHQTLQLSRSALVPLAPDMASISSLQFLQDVVEQLSTESETPVQMFYLLTRFDASLRLHADIRELLARQLGDRLLPFVIRRSNAFSEAFAEGTTVMDYAPDSPAAEDIGRLTQWVRELNACAAVELPNLRWRQS